MTNYPLIKPLTDEQINSGVRVLENNRKKATHFVEVYTNGGKTNQEFCKRIGVPSYPYVIDNLHNILSMTISVSVLRTIAIFKIRAK